MGSRHTRAVVLGVVGLAVATVWGLAVSVGASRDMVRRAEVPDVGFDRQIGKAQTVIRAPWGTALGQLGVSWEGEGRGPSSLGVDDRGRSYVLDCVNQRVVRYEGSTATTAFALPEGEFDDIVVVRDHFVVLERNENRKALVFDEDGAQVGTLPVSPSLDPIRRLAVSGEDVMVETVSSSAAELHRIGKLDGTPATAEEQAVSAGDPRDAAGDRFETALGGTNDFEVRIKDKRGALKRRLQVHSSRDVGAVLDVYGDRFNNVYVVQGLYKDDPKDPDNTRTRLVVAKFSPEGELIGRAETRNDLLVEPLRKIVVTDEGEVYQLVTDKSGASVLRWSLGR